MLKVKSTNQTKQYTLFQIENLKILQLLGEPATRAKSCGELIKQHIISDASLEYFATKIPKALNAFGPIVGSLLKGMHQAWAKYLNSKSPQAWQAEIWQFAAAAGITRKEMQRAITLPEMSCYFNAWNKLSFMQSVPPFGCTSVAQKTENEYVYGRNLDFSGAHTWDKYPAIYIHLPNDKKELKHIAFASDAAFMASITGINEKGICLSMHQNFTKVTTTGIPIFYLGEMLLRQADSIESAIDFLQKNRPGPIWTFVLTDLYKKKTVSVECSKKLFSVTPMEGNYFAQSNHLYAHQEQELIRSATYENSKYRKQKALDLLKQSNSQETLENVVAEVLAYQKDEKGELSSFYDIMKAHTIQSVIYKLESDGEIYIYSSYELAPSSSGNYLKFSLKDLWNSISEINYAKVQLTALNEQKRQNQKNISAAFKAYFDENNIEKAIDFLKEQNTIQAKLFLATANYQLKKYQDVIGLMQSLEISKIDNEIMQSDFYRLLLLSNYFLSQDIALDNKQQTYHSDEVQKIIYKLDKKLDEKLQLTQELYRLIQNLKLRKRLKAVDTNVCYDFFTAVLSSHPHLH